MSSFVQRSASMISGRLSAQPSFGLGCDSPSLHRLFFAIRPPVAANIRLTHLMARLRHNGIMPGRSVEPERLHLTLYSLRAFRDLLPPSLVRNAGTAADSIRTEPFIITFDRVGGTKGPFLLRPSDALPALRAFRDSLNVALMKAGLRPHAGPAFSPHITLSYDLSDAPEIPIDPISWTVQEFTLIESLHGRHRHIERGRWLLRG